MVKVVNEHNEEIGSATRGQVRSDKLWHRVSYIFIITKQNELLVQVRNRCKDYCPGFYDLASAGGVVDPGEDDHAGAKRELLEELGIEVENLTFVKTCKYQPADGSDNLFQNIYLLKDFDAEAVPLTLQESEVERMENWAVSDIDARL